MSGKGKTNAKTQQQIDSATYNQSVLGTRQSNYSADTRSINAVKNVYAQFPEEDIRRALEEYHGNVELVLNAIADEPTRWEEVNRKPKTEKPVKPKFNKFSGGRDSPKSGNKTYNGSPSSGRGGSAGQKRNNEGNKTEVNQPNTNTVLNEAVELNKVLGNLSLQQAQPQFTQQTKLDYRTASTKGTSVAPQTQTQLPSSNTTDSKKQTQSPAPTQPATKQTISWSSKLQQSLPQPVQVQSLPPTQKPTQQTQLQTVNQPTQKQAAPKQQQQQLQQTQTPQQSQPQEATTSTSNVSATSTIAPISVNTNSAVNATTQGPVSPNSPNKQQWKIKESKDSKDLENVSVPSTSNDNVSTSELNTQLSAGAPPTQNVPPQSTQTSTSAIRPPATSTFTTTQFTSPVVLPTSSRQFIDSKTNDFAFGTHDFEGSKTSATAPTQSAASNTVNSKPTSFNQPPQRTTPPTQQQQFQSQVSQQPHVSQQYQQTHSADSIGNLPIQNFDQQNMLDYQSQPIEHNYEQDQIGHHPIPPYSYLPPHAGPTHHFLPSHPYPFQYSDGQLDSRPLNNLMYDPLYQQSQYQATQTGLTGITQQTQSQDASKFNRTTGTTPTPADHKQQQQQQQTQAPYSNQYGNASEITNAHGSPQASQAQRNFPPNAYQPPTMAYYPPYLLHQYPMAQNQFSYGHNKYYPGPANFSYQQHPTGATGSNVFSNTTGEELSSADQYKHQQFPGMHSTQFYSFPGQEQGMIAQPQAAQQSINQQGTQQATKTTQQGSASASKTTQSFSPPPNANGNQDAFKSQMYGNSNGRDSFYNNMPSQYGQSTTHQYNPYQQHNTMNQTNPYTGSTQRNQQSSFQ